MPDTMGTPDNEEAAKERERELEKDGTHATDDNRGRKQDRLSVAAFILGILSILCSVSIYGIITGSTIVGCVLAIIGLVLGLLARKEPSAKNGLAQAGIVLCIIGLVSCCIISGLCLITVGTQNTCILS